MALETDKSSIDANYVTFYRKAVQNNYKSAEAGHPIFEDVDYIRIASPGGYNIVETPVRGDHKARYPRLWANYERAMKNEEVSEGTPIAEWPQLTRAQCETLRAMSFYTVEQLASASDLQIQQLQMVAPKVREMAQAWLKQANSRELLKAAEEKAAKEELEKQELKRRLEELEAKLAKAVEQKPDPKIESEPRQKRKYTKRVKEEPQKASVDG